MPKVSATVAQDATKPVERAVLAQAIVDMSKAAKKLADSGLNRKAVVVLVAHHSKLPARDVSAVLDSLETLTAQYTR